MNSKWNQSALRLDLWTICDKGHTHWGAAGAAGLLFCCSTRTTEPIYLLERRSTTVDHSGTWGIPGGAIRRDETVERAAQREAEEEIGPLPHYDVTNLEIQDCGGGWKFYILTAIVAHPFVAHCVCETDAVAWFARKEMHGLSLHPGFHKWVDEHCCL